MTQFEAPLWEPTLHEAHLPFDLSTTDHILWPIVEFCDLDTSHRCESMCRNTRSIEAWTKPFVHHLKCFASKEEAHQQVGH